MARLPIVNGDPGNWGSILNEFLEVEHNPDGTLKSGGSLAAKANNSAVVHLTGDETVAGVKTFSSSPVVPTPTVGTDVANKDYVDTVASSGAPDADATTKGVVQLAGDLSGTAASPAVAAGAISATKLASDAVTTLKILDGNVTGAKLASNAVDSTKLADNAVDTSAIQDSAVTDAKIDTVDGGKITGSIDVLARVNVSEGGSSVGSRRGINFVEGSNVTLTIADNPGQERVDVTIASSGAAGSPDADGSTKGIIQLAGDLTGTASSPAVANGAISTAKLANNAVDSTKLADNAVDTNAIQNGAVTGAKIDSGLSDPVAGTAGLRTLGTGAQQAAAGNHAHAIAGITGLQTALDSKADLSTLLPVYYATEYGLVGDGSTDDTAAIHSAVAAATAAGGGIVQLPAGSISVTGITLQSRVYLRGAGMRSTTLVLANNSDTHVVRNKVSNDVGVTDPNAQWCGVFDLEIDGNKSNQTSGHGIYFSLDPLTAGSKPAADDYFDTHHFVMNVRVRNVKDTAVWSEGRSETRFINVVTYSSDQYGFRVGYDTWLQDCTASWAGLHGFFCEDASSFTLDGCKAFYCGQINATTGYGFKFDNCHTAVITGCTAQDNRGGGFQLDNGTDGLTLISCVADSNSRVSAGTHPGFDLWESSYNSIIGTATERVNPGTQRNAVRVRSNSAYNYIRLGFVSMNGGVLGNAIANAVDDATNEIRINGSVSEALEQVTYAASITPDPTAGAIKTTTLTGNMTVNAPTGTNFAQGTRMTFVFTQDGTGGYSVSWNAVYRTNWTPSTTAGNTNSITFIYDGTNWQEVSASTPLPSINTLLPSQTGNSGKFLTTNGSSASWGSAPTSETVAVLVASSEAPASVQAIADFVCDGTNDQSEINSAIDMAAALQSRSGVVGATQQGKVELTGGRFNIGGSILMRTGVTLCGQGQLTELRAVSLSASTGAGTDAAVIKAYDTDTHMTTVTNLWINGNAASGGSASHGIFYEGTTAGGEDLSGYPDTSPDPDVSISNLYISNFGNGTRHGIYINTDMRGTMISNCQMRSFSGHGIYFNSSADSHLHNIHMGTVTGTGFYIAGGNIKLTNCKAYYCDTYGFHVTSGRGVLSACEAQDNAIGFNLAIANLTCSGIVADTSSTDNIIIGANRITIAGFTSLNRGSGRYGTTTNGITFTGTPTDCCITGVVHASNITTPVNGTITGARNFIRIPDGTTLNSQG